MTTYYVTISLYIDAKNKNHAIKKLKSLLEDDTEFDIDTIIDYNKFQKDYDVGHDEPLSNSHNDPDNYPGHPL